MNAKIIVKNLLAGMLLTACNYDYVVTDKGDDKIVYHPIRQPNDLRVMLFNNRDKNFYPYIHVGDTISCKGKYTRRKALVKSTHPKDWLEETYVISALNGKTFAEVQCDSIVRALRREKVK